MEYPRTRLRSAGNRPRDRLSEGDLLSEGDVRHVYRCATGR
jgi:hypothetical protein